MISVRKLRFRKVLRMIGLQFSDIEFMVGKKVSVFSDVVNHCTVFSTKGRSVVIPWSFSREVSFDVVVDRIVGGLK